VYGLLGALEKLLKANTSFVMSVWLSARPHGKSCLPSCSLLGYECARWSYLSST